MKNTCKHKRKIALHPVCMRCRDCGKEWKDTQPTKPLDDIQIFPPAMGHTHPDGKPSPHNHYQKEGQYPCEREPLNDFKDEEQGWEKHFSNYWGKMFECGDFEALIIDIKETISKEREEGYKKGRSDIVVELSQANLEEQKKWRSRHRDELLREMLSECDKYQNEDGRLLVVKFMNKGV